MVRGESIFTLEVWERIFFFINKEVRSRRYDGSAGCFDTYFNKKHMKKAVKF